MSSTCQKRITARVSD